MVDCLEEEESEMRSYVFWFRFTNNLWRVYGELYVKVKKIKRMENNLCELLQSNVAIITLVALFLSCRCYIFCFVIFKRVTIIVCMQFADIYNCNIAKASRDLIHNLKP